MGYISNSCSPGTGMHRNEGPALLRPWFAGMTKNCRGRRGRIAKSSKRSKSRKPAKRLYELSEEMASGNPVFLLWPWPSSGHTGLQHSDHSGEIRSFPNAKFYVNRVELETDEVKALKDHPGITPWTLRMGLYCGARKGNSIRASFQCTF